VVVADSTGAEQRLAFLEGGPARARVVARQGKRAEGEGAEERYARLATDLDRFLCIGERLRPAPGPAMELRPEDQRLGFEAPRPKLSDP
jgi:hypothetical protein